MSKSTKEQIAAILVNGIRRTLPEGREGRSESAGDGAHAGARVERVSNAKGGDA